MVQQGTKTLNLHAVVLQELLTEATYIYLPHSGTRAQTQQKQRRVLCLVQGFSNMWTRSLRSRLMGILDPG